MKVIRCIGYRQNFKIVKKRLFRSDLFEDAYVERGFHYFYADENESAEDIYLQQYDYRKEICRGWGDIKYGSENVNIIDIDESQVKDIQYEIVEIAMSDVAKVKELLRDLSAEEFTEWWFSLTEAQKESKTDMEKRI